MSFPSNSDLRTTAAETAQPPHLPVAPKQTPAVTLPQMPGEEAEDVWPRPDDQPKTKKEKLKEAREKAKPTSWLDGDPFGWLGKRVRSRKTGAIFVVRNVYRTGRADLEKNWMTYSYAIQTIRADFEPYS